jgi:hypothetical protein
MPKKRETAGSTVVLRFLRMGQKAGCACSSFRPVSGICLQWAAQLPDFILMRIYFCHGTL